jgi:hypothetical protein
MDFYSFLADQKPELQVEFCGDIDRLRIAGRAIDYVKSHPDTETCGRQTIYGHRIKIVDNKVLCGIQIAANGNIGFTDERDYETDDTFAIGNILNDSLSNVIKRNNTNCLLTCAESKALDIARDTEYLFKSTGKFDHTFMNLLRFKNAEILIPQIISLRGEAHKMYPYVPAQEIISAFYFPTRSGMFNYLIDGMIKMLKKSPVTIADVKRTVEPSLYRIWISEEAPNKGADDCANVLMFLLGHLRTFGTGDYLREYYSDAFKTIEALNEKYANGELVWDNSHNFDCK